MVRFAFAPVICLAILFPIGGCKVSPMEDPARKPLSRPDIGGLDDPTGGYVRGVVRYEGQAPQRAPIDMGVNPTLRQHWQAEGVLPRRENFIPGKDNALQNVLVYVSRGTEQRLFPADMRIVEMKIRGCMFDPHVLAMRLGQKIRIDSRDVVIHRPSVHRAPDQRIEAGRPPQDTIIERLPVDAQLGVELHCQKHAWETAYLHVLDHPFFAVTGEEGTFELRGLPAGQYEIAVWHEDPRWQADPPTRTINLSDRATAVVNFTFKQQTTPTK